MEYLKQMIVPPDFSIIWGWVKTLVPCREPQVIAGIYGCE